MAKKILVNIILIILLLTTFVLSYSDYANSNMVLFFTTLIIIILFNSKKFAKVSNKMRKTTFLVLVFIMIGYILFPKNNTMCGAPANGTGCTSHYCVGLPAPLIYSKPICWGKSFRETYAWYPNKNF